MDIEEARQEQQETQEWARCDPFTLVTAAKRTLYGDARQGNVNPSSLKPLEEVVARFEQQTRASLGAGAPIEQQQPAGSRG